MSVAGVWTGLAESAFVADVTDHDRDPARLAVTIIAGAAVGVASAIAAWTLLVVPYTFLAGLGEQGLGGVAVVAERFNDPDARGLGITLLRILVATVTNGVFFLGFVTVAARVAGHPLHHYLTAAGAVRWRLAFVGFGLSVAALGPVVMLERLSTFGAEALPVAGVARDLGGRLWYAASAALLLPSAAVEELMFRGWLLRQTSAFSRQPGVMIVFTAVVFAAAHFDFDPGAFLTRALMGAGFAYMTLRLGGVEFAAGAHAANNVLIFLFIEPLTVSTVDEAPGFSLGASFADLFLVAGYVLITEAVVRIPMLRRWAGVRLEEIAPAFGAPRFG
jgi:hypothetical protein